MTSDRLRGINAILNHLAESDNTSSYSSDNVNPYVLRRIARHISSIESNLGDRKAFVVEFGARAGALGKMLSEIFEGINYLGVEPCLPSDRKCFNIYESTCEQICQDSLGLQILGKADIIVYADVLEHLVDPWSHLKLLSEHSKKGVVIVASLPNILHHSFLSSLGKGRFDYEEWGVMDLTHLRFFTLSTMHELFQATGWDSTQHDFDAAADPDGLRLINEYRAGELEAINFGNFSYYIRSNDDALNVASYQFILSAVKAIT